MIPNIVHFCFGFSKDFGKKGFSFVHYLAVRTAHEVNRPERINFFYKYEPSGEWWEKSKPLLNLIQIEPPQEIFGKPLRHFAHQSDVVRLEALLKHGGIYLDMDVLCLKPLKPLMEYDFVMGIQDKGGRYHGLCNAVILSKPDALLLKLWYEKFRSFRSKGRDRFWDEHAVKAPTRLAREHPDAIHIEGERSFFWPPWREPDRLWRNSGEDFSQSFCIHLWETLWWDKYLKKLSPEYLKKSDSTFARLFRHLV